MEEAWFIILVSLCVCVLIRVILLFFLHKKTLATPPGPPHIPIITSFLWLKKSFIELEPFLRTLAAKHGPIFTLRIGSRPVIFIANRALAHQALIQNGSFFSDRPKGLATGKILVSLVRFQLKPPKSWFEKAKIFYLILDRLKFLIKNKKSLKKMLTLV